MSVEGSAYERGREYGAQAGDRIAGSLSLYRRVFRDMADMDWPSAVSQALIYRRPIERFGAHYLEEMQGMAKGAQVGFGDIMALNARTEIMFSAVAARTNQPCAGGCSSFALARSASTSGHVMLGQNWDWLPEAINNLIILKVQQEDAPSYVTVVEAGLLAKMGMNSAGVGLTTNTLISTQDKGSRGVPYHVLLRSVFDCEAAAAAASRISSAWRASSGNYLIADACDHIIDVEAVAGRPRAAEEILPVSGRICRTNHFTTPIFRLNDVMTSFGPDSFDRLDRLTHLLASGTRVGQRSLEMVLRDHVNRPGSVCRHADETRAWFEQSETLVSVIFDLEAKAMWLAVGAPCASEYEAVILDSDVSR